MITVIAEHSVDLSLLPEKANILDLGCRNFLFAMELTRQGHWVRTVDPDSAVLGGHIVAYTSYPQMIHSHFRVAITNENGLCRVNYSKDPQATTVTKAMIPLAGFDVQMYTLKSFSEMVGVTFWDLIKFDIEGSEYEVITSLTEPPAKQLSIEFHLHTKIYGDAQVKEMEDKLLSLGYFPVKHDKTSQHGLGLNYWDSCWILKDTGGENV